MSKEDLKEECYPKWIYHAEEEAKVVHSKAEHEAAGKGWFETPVVAEVSAEAEGKDKKDKKAK